MTSVVANRPIEVLSLLRIEKPPDAAVERPRDHVSSDAV
jgi:hypothetical protein